VPNASVRFFPVTERMKQNIGSEYIVAQAVLSPPNPPLSFSRLQTLQLLNDMSSSAPVGVFRENGDLFLHGIK
jgi:hypothetical protein